MERVNGFEVRTLRIQARIPKLRESPQAKGQEPGIGNTWVI